MNEQAQPTAPAAEERTNDGKSYSDYELEIATLRSDFAAKLLAADLRTEAVRAGMIDLDGLKLANTASITSMPDGASAGIRAVIDELKQAKPWLFAISSSSSSLASVPPSQPPRQKSAMEMTHAEYVAARAAIVARR